MPAKSKKQQRFMGMVHAAQKGELENPSKEVAEAAKSMSKKDAKDFAETKHGDLPESVEKEAGRLGFINGYKEAGLLSNLLHSILYGGEAESFQQQSDKIDDRIKDVRDLKRQRQQGTSKVDKWSTGNWSMPIIKNLKLPGS